MKKLKKFSGFTFVEVLVSLVILSVGIVAIFKSYFISLDHMSHLTNRIYVGMLLDNDMNMIQKNLDVYNTLPIEFPENRSIQVGFKKMDLVREIKIREVDTFTDIFEVELIFKWQEKEKEVQLSRFAYLSDFD